MTRRPRARSWWRRAWRANTGRVSSPTTKRRESGKSLIVVLGAKRAGRNDAGRDVGVLKRVELRPQNIALELHRADAGLLLGAGQGVSLDEVQREVGIARRLREPAAEIGHG